MTVRTQQIGSLLQRSISQLLQRKLADPRLRGVISVTRVDVSPDMRNARVFISVLPAQYEKTTLRGLQSSTGRVRSLLRKTMTTRAIPAIEFRLDQSLKNQASVFDAIAEGMKREEPPS